ncbi:MULTISPECIES: hypothetical protein [Mesorhizobium]|uniref:Uncharacterized protein n=3 Tax=Phyllobacteriaceae TaxID=69277 RepID=A0A1A5HUS3_RHILI|nr:hypothetical protein [Mesorhizobium loti]ETA72370.1 hypothetical protein MesloDRAFT_1241 [Mesorhizobium japonicum R7A]MBE1709697.1 hypothetical protein [Mesorhizobium japonicum]MBE1714366.1 hypothetical protein [Mesorhizobium japonicum]MUT25346.1 hypothetical protein [Mesorhizobium japonicum]MUT28600.1 hypothetical protein [Mesorhizobium japonicum]
MGKRQNAPNGEAVSELEQAAQRAIEAAGGDAVVALLRALARNIEVERELALFRAAVSNGFSRGWHKARP